MREQSLVGGVIANYEILRELGRGGMGVVYKAHEQSLQRMVALKVLPPHLSSDPVFVKRFEREARAAAVLVHPHIVTIYAVGQDGGYHYIAMEYIQGKTLASLIAEDGQIEVGRALDITLQVADALAEAHRNDIIHRDVKPGNIMIDRAGRAKVLDFGLAKVLYGLTDLTTKGLLIGTPRYMSPEQCQGLDLDPRTDVYSLGVVLFEMLAGRPPFLGETPLVLMRQILEEPLPGLREMNRSVPAHVCRMVSKMVAKDRTNRYDCAESLCGHIRAALRAGASPVGLPEKGAERPGNSDLETIPAPGARPISGARMLRPILSVGIAAVLIVMSGLLTLKVMNNAPPVQTPSERQVPGDALSTLDSQPTPSPARPSSEENLGSNRRPSEEVFEHPVPGHADVSTRFVGFVEPGQLGPPEPQEVAEPNGTSSRYPDGQPPLVVTARPKHASPKMSETEVKKTVSPASSQKLRPPESSPEPRREDPALRVLVAQLSEKDPAVSTEAKRALKHAGSPAVPHLIAMLREEQDAKKRSEARDLLVEIGKPSVEPLLSCVRTEQKTTVRQQAIEALGAIGDTRAVETLLSAMKDKEREVRAAAALALGKIGDTRAVAALVEALSDYHAQVREPAAAALGKLRAQQAVGPLIERLNDTNPTVRKVAAKALGDIGDRTAVRALEQARNDSDPYVRVEARNALDRMK